MGINLVREKYLEALENLKREAIDLGNLVHESMEKSVQALVDGDAKLADVIIKKDPQIYKLGAEIEDKAIQLIALQQPMAKDLRFIVTVLRMVGDLERIGRYSMHIAEIAKEPIRKSLTIRLHQLNHMAATSLNMLNMVLNSLVENKIETLSKLSEMDDEVDKAYNEVFERIVAGVREDPAAIRTGLNLLLVARYLERIADHACNIAERLTFKKTGERVDIK
ncbi:MAG: phosphate transport system regulatory protein PhoU [Methanobacteriota archaeon]|nr:MAG: phosphate transport system regulatory protein PhoU [Euryarchaeota archaeon]